MVLYQWEFLKFTIKDFFDILFVALVLYLFINIIKGTRVVSMSFGVLFIVLIWLLSDWFNLSTLNWMFSNVIKVGVIALLVVFQPELRTALIKLGDFTLIDLFIDKTEENTIEEIIEAIKELQELKFGAIIVIERNINVSDNVQQRGVFINADVKKDLLVTIFYKDTPLHDGAVIIKSNKIIQAGCMLPLAEIPSDYVSHYHVGSRHRAGVGITKETDAISIILSEETGRISIAEYGHLRHIYIDSLKGYLMEKLT